MLVFSFTINKTISELKRRIKIREAEARKAAAAKQKPAASEKKKDENEEELSPHVG